MTTFFKVIWDTAHFKTRFLNFIKSNPNIAKKVIYFVDNDEIYNDYKLDYNIVSLDSLRKNHEWSHNYELFYKESNDTEYVRNFWDFYREKNTLLPVGTLRFIFLYMYEKNILKFKYLPNNSFITDNESLIDNYFNPVQPGEFTTMLHHWSTQENKYVPKIHNNMVGTNPLIYDSLKTEFPHLIIPREEYSMELHMSTFSFKNKDHVMLFYKIWNLITKVIYEFDIRHFFPMHAYAYIDIGDVLGFLFRVFEVNFNYKLDHWLKYWDNNIMGFHKTTWHDNWYYKYPKNANEELVHYTWGNFGNFIIPINPTIETYIERNKELINTYFMHHLGGCEWEITENNKVFIKFIN